MGFAELYEEYRETATLRGFEDPAIVFAPGFQYTSYTPQRDRYHTGRARTVPTPVTVVKPNNKPNNRVKIPRSQEVKFCFSLLDICSSQLKAGQVFQNYKEPRSDAFHYWFEITQNNIHKKEKAVSDYLKNDLHTVDRVPDVNNSTNISQASQNLLYYIVRHILYEDIMPQAIETSELINIIEDATYYIACANNNPLMLDETNSVFIDYLKKNYDLKLRDDYCCKNCNSDLFVGIPYCLRCCSILAR